MEIQKYGYLFGGERASCYSSDMVMWQYERVKSSRELNLLQEFYFIPLDIFFRIKDNKRKTIRNELEAWLYFIGSDKPEDIRRVIQKFPKFEEMYREASVFRYHPEEAEEMFSDALRK